MTDTAPGAYWWPRLLLLAVALLLVLGWFAWRHCSVYQQLIGNTRDALVCDW